jgi:membrane protein DedA with SNARE-associated domain
MHFLLPLALFGINLNKVMEWIGQGGYYALFGLLFACGLGLPLPEDIPLTVAGIFVGSGHMHLAVAGIVAWCGIIGGDCVLYSLGRKYGLNITKVPLIGHHVTKARIERAEQLFEKYGIWVVAIGRLFAGIRGGMVVAAGTIRFNFVKFIIADGLAAIVSGGLFIALGMWLGKNLETLERKVEEFKIGLGIFGVVAAIGLTGYFWWRHKTQKTTTEAVIDKAVEKDLLKLPPVPDQPQQAEKESADKKSVG